LMLCIAVLCGHTVKVMLQRNVHLLTFEVPVRHVRI